MSRKGLWSAAALVVVSNLGAFALAALNRSGEPEAILELTERELRLPERQTDNTSLSLNLVFDRPHERGPWRPPSEAGWFDREKLQSIGFDCGAPVTAQNASRYRNIVARSTYAVLEYEGEAWRARLAEAPPQPPDRASPGGSAQLGAERVVGPLESPEDRLRQSHLMAIDVGNDPARLRAQYPDWRRSVIVEATAALMFVSRPGREPFLAGRVVAVFPGEINVPRE